MWSEMRVYPLSLVGFNKMVIIGNLVVFWVFVFYINIFAYLFNKSTCVLIHIANKQV